ncbi:hypothetical protein OJAV_G00109080 [Oryzias javanicus]|uniref:Uncharacterized protein n=1 Tax=Oryzias javanicus TaxID=123683 RepID=A0A3S2PH84_ORYJA|nr:hypothetical protein OJAV_G00109080 [Oryzias javanicus]
MERKPNRAQTRQCGCTRSFGLSVRSGEASPREEESGSPRLAKSGSKSQPRAATPEVRRGGAATASHRNNLAEGHQVW